MKQNGWFRVPLYLIVSGVTNPDNLHLAPAGRALLRGWAMGMDTGSVGI